MVAIVGHGARRPKRLQELRLLSPSSASNTSVSQIQTNVEDCAQSWLRFVCHWFYPRNYGCPSFALFAKEGHPAFCGASKTRSDRDPLVDTSAHFLRQPAPIIQ